MPLDDFRTANLDNWNNRAEIHAVSRQYDVPVTLLIHRN
jgi:hypothetical protein